MKTFADEVKKLSRDMDTVSAFIGKRKANFYGDSVCINISVLAKCIRKSRTMDAASKMHDGKVKGYKE